MRFGLTGFFRHPVVSRERCGFLFVSRRVSKICSVHFEESYLLHLFNPRYRTELQKGLLCILGILFIAFSSTCQSSEKMYYIKNSNYYDNCVKPYEFSSLLFPINVMVIGWQSLIYLNLNYLIFIKNEK